MAVNSGASNADWVSVADPIFDGDVPRMGAFGPEMVSPSFRLRCTGGDTWTVTGLRATSSHDLRVDDVFVPAK